LDEFSKLAPASRAEQVSELAAALATQVSCHGWASQVDDCYKAVENLRQLSFSATCEAHIDTAGSFVGVKNPDLPVPAYRPNELFRSL
jgi:hypothetical protein